MVVSKVISSSFCQTFLLLLVVKSCGFLEPNEYKDSCTAKFYKRSYLNFCPKERQRMAMGNLLRTSKPRVIDDFGYQFKEVNGEQVLLDKEEGRGFKFDVFGGDRARNQNRYEDLGEAITEYVYEYLETKLDLDKVTIPVDAGPNEPKGFFFRSKNAFECDKLMILIHGSGVVRAGQWARSLIINHSFESGTMVPYIEKAKEEDFGVLITNGNHNYDEEQHKWIKGSENPQDHFVYVWNNFIKNAKAKHIVIVAHSFGGVVVLHGLRNIKEAKERIKAVAFTDSVHSVGRNESSDIKQFFKKRTRNWVSSSDKLDTRIPSYYNGDTCELVSAGTTEHVWTSHCAKDSVFRFFKEKLDEEEKGKDDDNNEMKKKNTNKTGKCAGKGSSCEFGDSEEDDQEGINEDEQQKGTETENEELEKKNPKDKGSEKDNMLTRDGSITGTPGEETVQPRKDNMVTGDNLITGIPGEETEQPGKDNMVTGDNLITETPGEETEQPGKDNMVTEDNLITESPGEETEQPGKDNMVTEDNLITESPGEETEQPGKDNMVTEDNLITESPGEETEQPGKDNMVTGDDSITETLGEETVQPGKDNMVTGDGIITGTPEEEMVQPGKDNKVTGDKLITKTPEEETVQPGKDNMVTGDGIITGTPEEEMVQPGKDNKVTGDKLITKTPEEETVQPGKDNMVTGDNLITKTPEEETVQPGKDNKVTGDNLITKTPGEETVQPGKDSMVTGDNLITETPGEETVQPGKDSMVTGDNLITGTPGEETEQPGKNNMVAGDGLTTGTPGEETEQPGKDNMVTGDGSITGTLGEVSVRQGKGKPRDESQSAGLVEEKKKKVERTEDGKKVNDNQGTVEEDSNAGNVKEGIMGATSQGGSAKGDNKPLVNEESQGDVEMETEEEPSNNDVEPMDES